MVDRKPEIAEHFIHAGAGTGLAIVNLGTLIPGFIPSLALTTVVAVVLVAPVLILGVAAVLVAAPFYLLSRVARRARRRRCGQDQPPVVPGTVPVPRAS